MLQKVAATNGDYVGSFYWTRGGPRFDAAANFALVWEKQPWSLTTPSVGSALHLQQFNGSRWTTVLRTTVRNRAFGPPQGSYQPFITSPQLRVSVASPTRAVATLLHLPPVNSTRATLVTHTWNGAKWSQQANATITLAEAGSSLYWILENPYASLQALSSGSALMTLATGMWRLA